MTLGRHKNARSANLPDAMATVTSVVPGDCFVSPEAYPEMDSIIAGDRKRSLHLEHLTATLKLLELIVVYERLLVPYVPPQPVETSSVYLQKGDIVSIQSIETPRLQIAEDIKHQLAASGILFYALLPDELPDGVYSPFVYAETYIKLSREVRSVYNDMVRSNKDIVRRAGGSVNLHPERAALAEIATLLGIPYTLSEYCAYLDVPLYLSQFETIALRTAEQADSKVRRGAIDFIYTRFTDASKGELSKLSSLGLRTVFPETPIACKIISNASSVDDILRVTLQLRAEFASFRADLRQLEADIRDESVPIKTKRRRYRSLLAMAEQLWPEKERAYFKEAWEVTDLLTSVASVAGAPITTPEQLLKIVRSVPGDTFRNWFSRRKVRVLIKARRQFLNSRNHIDQVARVFALPKRHVREVVRAASAA